MVYLPTVMIFIKDPWSIPADFQSDKFKECVESLAFDATAGKRQQKKRHPKDPEKTDKRRKVDSLADWACIPPKESFWVRGLLDGGATCTLSVLPCMRDELLMPRVVFESINSNRGRIVFYANVEHALLCPRYFAQESDICVLNEADIFVLMTGTWY